MLLRAFRGLAVVWFKAGECEIIQMTPLNQNQEVILKLLKVPDIYKRIIEVLKTKSRLRER